MTVGFFDDDLPDNWGNYEAMLFADMSLSNMDMYGDPFVRGHLHDSLFDFDKFDSEVRQGKLDELKQYLRDEYDINFDDIFDWESWREWYDS